MTSYAVEDNVQMSGPGLVGKVSDGAGLSKRLLPEEVRGIIDVYSVDEIDAGFVTSEGSYSNPSWLTSLAWSKLSGVPSSVSSLSGVNTGDQDLSAYATISGSVASFVALAGSYSNPTWITALAWSKLTGVPAAVSALSGTNTGDQDLSSYLTSSAAAAAYQPLNTNLTAISALVPSNDDFIQHKAGAWTNRTVAQVKTDLGLTGTNSGDQTSIVGITGTKTQFNTACSDGDFLYVGDAPTPHTHGNITNVGAIGSTSGLPIITTTSGVLTTGAFGTSAGSFAEGNDSRITGALSASTASSTYVPLVRTLNGVDLSANRTISVGTSGTDANWSGLTLNIPDASASARGLVTADTQTIAGAKTFTGDTTMTGGFVLSSGDSSIYLSAGGSSRGVIYYSTSELRLFSGTYPWVIESDSGFKIRNTANTSDAALTCGAITTSGDLKFTDATYDIGKSGATRPRDGWFSRKLNVGSGISLVDNTSVAYGYAVLFDGTNSGIENAQGVGLGLILRGNTVTLAAASIRPLGYSYQDLTLGTTDGACFIAGKTSTGALNWSCSAGGLHIANNVFSKTTPSLLAVYSTYTSTTSYERINVKGTASANFEIGPENGSAGGTLRGLTIGGYSAGNATITPWLTFTNAGATTFASTITAADSITTNGLFSSDRYAVSANYRFRRANGTSSSPTQVTSGQAVGALSSFGYHDSGAFHSSAGAIVYFVAAESYTSGAQGTNIQFWTTPTASTTSAKRLCIEASGEVTLEAGSHLQTSGAGFKIGTATSQKIGFWNATPVVQQVLATGAGATVDNVITFLQTIGLCKQS